MVLDCGLFTEDEAGPDRMAKCLEIQEAPTTNEEAAAIADSNPPLFLIHSSARIIRLTLANGY